MNRHEAICCVSYQIGNLRALKAAHAEIEARRQNTKNPESELYGLFGQMIEGITAVKRFLENEAMENGEKTGNCARCGRYFPVLPYHGYCKECMDYALMLLGKRDAEFINGQTETKTEEDDE